LGLDKKGKRGDEKKGLEVIISISLIWLKIQSFNQRDRYLKRRSKVEFKLGWLREIFLTLLN